MKIEPDYEPWGVIEVSDEGDVEIVSFGPPGNGKKIYIAGPMSGYPEFNFPAFFETGDFLTKNGWVVFNPAKKDLEKTLDPDSHKTGDAKKAIAAGFDFREAFTWDTQKVIEADAIYMLPGWEHSPGASAEHAVAVAMKKHYPEYKIIYG